MLSLPILFNMHNSSLIEQSYVCVDLLCGLSRAIHI